MLLSYLLLCLTVDSNSYTIENEIMHYTPSPGFLNGTYLSNAILDGLGKIQSLIIKRGYYEMNSTVLLQMDKKQQMHPGFSIDYSHSIINVTADGVYFFNCYDCFGFTISNVVVNWNVNQFYGSQATITDIIKNESSFSLQFKIHDGYKEQFLVDYSQMNVFDSTTLEPKPSSTFSMSENPRPLGKREYLLTGYDPKRLWQMNLKIGDYVTWPLHYKGGFLHVAGGHSVSMINATVLNCQGLVLLNRCGILFFFK